MGGIVLFGQGKNALSTVIATETTVRIVATGLILIGVLEIISVVGVLRLKRTFWILGMVMTIAFVIEGAINGYFLFGNS